MVGRCGATSGRSPARTTPRALLAKLDFRLSDRHNLSLKYNHTWSEQVNGTFDVDTWARSANGLEKDHSNAVNGSLVSYLSSNTSNELRFQYSREDRPRPYEGPRSAALGPNPSDPPAARPFPDIAMDFASDFRFGVPFFLPVDYYDTRVQILDNLSIARGDHFIKLGAEFNRVNSVQTFIGFANSLHLQLRHRFPEIRRRRQLQGVLRRQHHDRRLPGGHGANRPRPSLPAAGGGEPKRPGCRDTGNPADGAGGVCPGHLEAEPAVDDQLRPALGGAASA